MILLALNWKMNKTPSQAREWCEAFQQIQPFSDQTKVAVMAPALDLPILAECLPEKVSFGAQDVSVHESGAYTGEISATMLQDIGCRYVIVGHSERREYHSENNATVAQKAIAAQQSGLIPIVCVGEGLEVREKGEHISYTLKQLSESLEGVSERVVIAYEPVWAIGTGKTATAEDAQEMAQAIREALSSRYTTTEKIAILYGGSVKPENIAEICAKQDVDGALVGGASLKVSDVEGLIQSLE